MKTSNLSSFDKLTSYSINGNYVDAYSLDGRSILINHRNLYNSLWLNYNQKNLNTVIRVTLFDNTTIDLTFNTKYLADGTNNGPLLNSKTFILPIQHKNIQLINNPTYSFQNNISACDLYYNAGLTLSAGTSFKMLAYPEEDSGGTPICVQLVANSGQEPEDCSSNDIPDTAAQYHGYWLSFELGTCS